MKIIFFVLSFFTLSIGACNNNIGQEFDEVSKVNYYGGNQQQKGKDMLVHNGRKYILGTSNSFNTPTDDIYLVCTDEQGQEIFTRTYGKRNASEEAVGFIKMKDRLLILFNTSLDQSDQTPNTYALIEVDFEGNNIDEKIFNKQDHLGTSILKISDDEFIITGQINGANYFVAKFLKNDETIGKEVWNESDSSISTAVVFKGHLIPGSNKTMLFAHSLSADANQSGQQILVFIINNENGFLVESKLFGGKGNDEFFDFEYYDGKYFIVGSSTSDVIKDTTLSNRDFLFFSFSLKGGLNSPENPITFRTFGGANEDIGKSIILDNNQDLIMFGDTQSYGGSTLDYDQIIVKISQNGVVSQDWLKNPRLLGADGDDFAIKALNDGGSLFFLGELSFSATSENVLLSMIKSNHDGRIRF